MKPWPVLTIFLTIIAYCVSIFAIVSFPALFSKILPFPLPAHLINKPVIIEGEVDHLIQKDHLYLRFDFRLLKYQDELKHAYLRLSWYGKYPALHVGERWRMTVKLKPPHVLRNPGTFNYRYQLLAEGVQATGYVVAQRAVVLLGHYPWHHPLNFIQEKIITTIAQSVKNPNLAAFLAALSTGSRLLMSPEQWRVFIDTGTSYLVVIAGLHIGIMASFMGWVIRYLWRRIPFLLLYFPAQQVGRYAALVGAWSYGLLSGLTVPTQRALIMITLFIFPVFKFHELYFHRRFLLAFILVVIFQPFAVLTPSFWLSFVAVAWIGYLLCGRYQPLSSMIWRWVGIQVAIFFGLVPLTLYYFHQISLMTIPASWVALPWLEIVMIPLCVMVSWIDLIWQGLGQHLFAYLALGLTPLWWYLHYLASFAGEMGQISLHSIFILFFVQMGVVLLFAPRGWPACWLGLIWLLPLFFPRVAFPQTGEVWLTLLDVGQGLSAVIETAHHRLVYDAGPKMDYFDAGSQIVVPYLWYRHINSIDTLLISHGDNDHLGGAAAILKQVKVGQVLTSVPERFSPQRATACAAKQSWEWDGVQFQILSPPRQQPYEGNNNSCVLKVATEKNAILLPGDIEKKQEKWLLSHHSQELAADILIAPHHGSRTSSSNAFIQAVHPHYVLFPVGYYNRYKLPASSVVQRYQQQQAMMLTTAESGAIIMRMNRQQIMIEVANK